MTAMVVWCVDSVSVMRDGKYVAIVYFIPVTTYLFSIPRVGDTCECDASNITRISCPYV